MRKLLRLLECLVGGLDCIRRSFCRILGVLVLLQLHHLGIINAQEAIVRIEVDEELSPEARIVLNRIFDPYSLEATLDLNTSKRVGLLCGLGLCSERRYELPENFQIPQASLTSLEAGEFYAIRSETDSYPDLVVFRETGRFDFPLNSKNGAEGVTILPLEERRLGEGIAVSAIEWVEASDLNWKGAQTLTARSVRSSEVEEVLSDLSTSEKSIRYYKVPDQNPQEIDELIQKASSLASISITRVEDSGAPENTGGAEWIRTEVEFTAESHDCKQRLSSWPHRISEVQEAITRSLEASKQIDFFNIDRSRILVVDTGLMSAAIEVPWFSPFLDVQPEHLLYPNYYYESTRLSYS